jgi:DNA modification methylase
MASAIVERKFQVSFFDDALPIELPEITVVENIDYEKEQMQKAKSFNGLSAKEWASTSRSVWNDVSSTRAKKHLIHGATYPEKLCDRAIRMYSKVGDIVLDPFLGTGTTALASIKANRYAIGIELTDKYHTIAETELKSTNLSEYELIKGDCLDVLDTLQNESIQLTFTSPPYADLIHKVEEDRTKRHKKSAFVVDNNATTNVYSNDDKDLGNMPLDKYTKVVEQIMKKIYAKTKKGGYNIWVVKDYRDMQNDMPYVDLHSAIANAGVKAGFKYHDLIIWDQNEHRKLVLLGYPSRFYVNQNHSYLVVLRKW